MSIKEQLIGDMTNCMSTEEILSKLLKRALFRNIPIESIRYYRRRQRYGKEQLVSVDCAGHNDNEATQIRLGRVRKDKTSKSGPQVNGYFDVLIDPFALPIVFQINPARKPGVYVLQEPPLKVCELQDDECNNSLGPGGQRPPWVDIPLRMAGRALGKLSCSLKLPRFVDAEELPKNLLEKLLEFQDYANIAIPYLESIRSLDINNPLEEAGSEIFTKVTYEQLYYYCTNTLRIASPFAYEAADIFVVSEDTLKSNKYHKVHEDNEFLVLRWSSSKSAGANKDFYRKQIIAREWSQSPELDGKGLTAWVWRNGTPLRLCQRSNDPNFEKQLRAYEPEKSKLEWAKLISPIVAEKVQSLLIVPIHAPLGQEKSLIDLSNDALYPTGGRVIGVIRFVNNKDNNLISPRDEVLLSRLADRCIGPKMVSLQHERTSKKIVANLDKVTIFRLDPISPSDESSLVDEFKDILRESVRTFFTSEGKAFLLNLICSNKNGPNGPEPDKFRTEILHDGLKSKSRSGDICDLEGTMTNFIMNHNYDFVFINDIPYAEKERCYRRLGPKDLCALGSVVQYERKKFGALIIISDRYDIFPAVSGTLVSVLATQIGMLLARREVLDFTICINGLRHDGISALNRIRADLVSVSSFLLPESKKMFNETIDFWGDVIDAHCRTGPPSLQDVYDECTEPINVQSCALVAASQAWAEVVRNGVAKPAINIHVDDDLEVLVWGTWLVVCIYNLLKNAWENSREGSVELAAKVTNDFLYVTISNEIHTSDPERLARINRSFTSVLPANHTVPSGRVDASGMGLHLVRRLAEWHRVPFGPNPGYRKGDLIKSIDPSNAEPNLYTISFTLILPCCISTETSYD